MILLHNYLAINVLKPLFEGTEGYSLQFTKLVKLSRDTSRSTLKITEDASSKIFGATLKTIMENELRKDKTATMPHFLIQIFEYLHQHVDVPGIFRISGVARKIKQLKSEIELGKDPDYYAQDCKPHVN